MAIKEFLLPDLGEGLTEGEIVQWLVAVGDTVVVDQAMVEIETAKAIVEVPSPFAGVVVALTGEPGTTVEVGAVLFSIDISDTPAQAAPAPAAPAQAQAASDDDNGASGNVLVGYGTAGSAAPSRRRRSARNGTAVALPEPSTPASPAGPVGQQGRPLAKPPVRKLAKDLGVDLNAVHATGEAGVITREDVLEAAHEDPGHGRGAGWAGAGERRIPMRGVRKLIAERMSTSRREIPEATSWVDCDATRLMRMRDQLNKQTDEIVVSPLALILRIAVAGLQQFPELNASIDGDEIVQHGAVHLGVAAQTERGLMVPVIRDAQHRSALDLAAELQRLAEGARSGTLTPQELTGSTFTVSNYGSFGVDGGNPVINYPEAAILGVGRISERPWVHKGKVRPRKVVQLSIAFDHRIVDGAEAAGFLRWVADRIESPALLLATL